LRPEKQSEKEWQGFTTVCPLGITKTPKEEKYGDLGDAQRARCALVVTLVTLTGVGSCTITAHQAGNASFNAAPDVARTFQIAAQGNDFDAVYLPLVVR
jgi:hypothetical protein